MLLSLWILTTVSTCNNTIKSYSLIEMWGIDSCFHCVQAKKGRNIGTKNHSSNRKDSENRKDFMSFNGTFRCKYTRQDIYWIIAKNMAITRHINPAQSQWCGISDGIISTWTTLSPSSFLSMLHQEMLYSLPENLTEKVHRCVSGNNLFYQTTYV
jgi:hypothetical protein